MRMDVPDFGTPLGAGRHGTVFHTRRNGRDVAVKVAPSPGVGRHEAAALTRFRHPHIVDLVEHPIEGAPLVLEFCAGGTVHDLLRRGDRRPPGDVAELLSPVIDAVAHVHAAGWIHGDISAANLGLRADGSPVLLDFGASRPADGSAITEGTPEFLGPLRQATTALDVRSLAVLALELLAPESRWDAVSAAVRHDLEAIVSAADGGERLTVDDLRLALRCGSGAGRLGRERSGGTMPFGPPPRPSATTPPDDRARPRRRALLVLPLVVVLAFALSTDLFGTPPVDATSPDPAIHIRAIESAAATLDSAGVWWSAEDGTLHHLDHPDGERWLVGQPGDLAAVGRWSCTDDVTLGVYRPSTGEWFVFDSWRDDAESEAPAQLGTGATLEVEIGADCDTPLVSG